MPSEGPLFNYNINFEGLRKIIEQVGVETNTNRDLIATLNS